MPLSKLQFVPGINRERTRYTAEGGWYDCDKIRFRQEFPEKIGGWQKKTESQYLGRASSIKPFIALDGSLYNGVGTSVKYYTEIGGAFNDITPLRSTTNPGDVTFTAVNGSSSITVNDTNHGAIIGDYVTFSDAVDLGGNITADVLNQEYVIDSITDSNTYVITAKNTSGNTVTANASDTGNGGASCFAAYQINTGLGTTVIGTGWGAGFWGGDGWGESSSLVIVGRTLRLWSEDNFGEDLILNYRDGGIYYWDKSAGSRAVALADRAGADPTTPTIAKTVLISDRDRHIIVFGCDPEVDIGAQDPLLIRFSDQENPLVWRSLPTNTAGELRIGSGSEIITAVETRQQIIVFTDVSLHAMQYLGPPFTFGINLVSENITIASPNAAKAANDLVFWMGVDDFYVFSGQVQNLTCTVRDYVFNDFNLNQIEKVFAALNSSYSEVWWFYPSANSQENDRYVVYNYLQNAWYYGTMARTAWVDRGINSYPLAANNGYLYNHEFGLEDGETASPLASYIESASIDIGDGEQFAFVRRLVPDVTFTGSTSNAPAVDMTVKVRNFPGENFSKTTDSTITQSAVIPVEQYTDQVHVRLRGRSITFRLSSSDEGVQWRIGSPRLDIRPDGRR